MANSPSDNSGHNPGIGFTEGDMPSVSKSPNRTEFSEYADDSNAPTSPQSGAGSRSRAFKKDAEDVGSDRMA